MRLVKFTQVHADTGTEGLIWINPEQVARVIPKTSVLENVAKARATNANTRISVASTAQGVAFWVKETPDEVVAALTGSSVAARLAANL